MTIYATTSGPRPAILLALAASFEAQPTSQSCANELAAVCGNALPEGDGPFSVTVTGSIYRAPSDNSSSFSLSVSAKKIETVKEESSHNPSIDERTVSQETTDDKADAGDGIAAAVDQGDGAGAATEESPSKADEEETKTGSAAA